MSVRLGILSTAHLHMMSYIACAKRMPNVEVTALWDDDVARGERVAAEQGIPFFRSLEEVIGRSDAVCVTSENSKHADLVEAAALRGKHAICEKPLALSPEEADRMISASRKAGVKLATAFPCPFSPAFGHLLKQVESGAIGRVLAVNATNHGKCPFGWFVQPALSGGGALIDHVVHVADLLWRILGTEPVTVQAQTGHNMYSQEWEDTAMLTLVYPNGVFATIDSSWSRPSSFKTWGDVTLKVVGEHGLLEADLFGQGLGLYSNRTGTYSLSAYGSNLDQGLFSDFIRAIEEGGEPMANGEDGWRAAKVALAGYRSVAEGGKAVPL